VKNKEKANADAPVSADASYERLQIRYTDYRRQKMDPTQQFTIDPNDPPTFEKVWKMFQETREEFREMFRETRERIAATDRRIEELSKKADRCQAEVISYQRETDRQIRELSKDAWEINNTFGKRVEEIASEKLWEKFYALGYVFTVSGARVYTDGKRKICYVDRLLENEEYAMAVEIKSELTGGDVNEHLERMEKVREQLDKRGDRRKLLGAVAGMIVTDGVRKYAQDKGLYVLVQSGDTVAVAEPPEGFKPREWCSNEQNH
jgi:hypothetical protein